MMVVPPREEILALATALSILRRLSGASGYPKFIEGEKRFAEYMVKHMEGASHAFMVVEEFDTDFPTYELFKAATEKYAEVCARCKRARWQHDKSCPMFETKLPFDEMSIKGRSEAERVTDARAIKEIVPIVPGVDPLVALLVESMRISLGMRGGNANDAEVDEYRRDYPETIAALEKDAAIDYHLLTGQYKKKLPGIGKCTVQKTRSLRVADILDNMVQATDQALSNLECDRALAAAETEEEPVVTE